MKELAAADIGTLSVKVQSGIAIGCLSWDLRFVVGEHEFGVVCECFLCRVLHLVVALNAGSAGGQHIICRTAAGGETLQNCHHY